MLYKLQPLATCMHNLQLEKMAIGLQISEPWLREYQVYVILINIVKLYMYYKIWTPLLWKANRGVLGRVGYSVWIFFYCSPKFFYIFYNLIIHLCRCFHQGLTRACKWVHLGATFSVVLSGTKICGSWFQLHQRLNICQCPLVIYFILLLFCLQAF